VASCQTNVNYTLCDLSQICVNGFSCSDPDNNLVSCQVVGHTLSSGQVCFTPVAGANTLTLIATDACGKADTCVTTVTVNLYPWPVISNTIFSGVMCGPGSICAPLPTVTGGKPPFTWTYNGRTVVDTVCVPFASSGTVTGTVIVTDACNHKDTASLTINATVNTAPVVTANPPASVFLCKQGDTVCVDLTIYDPDNGLTGTSQLGFIKFSDSTACFIPTAAGRYCDRVIVRDSCGLADTVEYCIDVTINRPPVCNIPDDASYVQCQAAQVCLPVSATDPDGNLAGCTKVSGPGQLVNGQWCSTPSHENRNGNDPVYRSMRRLLRRKLYRRIRSQRAAGGRVSGHSGYNTDAAERGLHPGIWLL